MIITKPLNNNVVMAKNNKQEEVIVVGTGIGFHKKAGDVIDERKIQKVFSVADNNKLAELISQIPGVYIELTEKIVQYARRKYHLELNQNIYLGLTDHIYFALQRLQENIDLDNPFLIDIQHFYQQEYKIGLYAKEMIHRMFHIQISDDEVGYIAMHIIENEFQHEGITKLIVTKDMSERKNKMIELGNAFIAFPGGTGTLEEITEIMSKVSLKQLNAPCIVYNLNGYYDGLKAMLKHMIDMGLSSEERQKGIYFAERLEQITDILCSLKED